jgi:hypothetical protein
MEGRGKVFRDSLQASEDFIMLNEHIAAELIKTGSIRKCGART